ncbi:protein kinase domain-containing protein [Dictyobacter vulcani]|nr:protein kinase [Dictyobacter vulcani]
MYNALPQRLDKYELQERLGHGGVAEVWKAMDTQLQRYVAIKMLHPNLREDPNFVARFQREAQLIAALHHPNIVQIHDFQIYQPHEPQQPFPLAYMVMDYVEGQTLAEYIYATSNVGKVPAPARIVNLFTSISLAIDYAHSKDMIHRDIKPANILLDKRNTTRNPMGEPILTDFGVAKLLSSLTNTQSGAQLGTPLYLSPEQAKGMLGNERSDLYSLGIILYEMVTGVLPFRGDTPMEVIMQHIHNTPISPTLINPNIPPALAQVIERSMAKNPAERYATASEMTIDIAKSLSIPGPETLGQPTHLEVWDRANLQTQQAWSADSSLSGSEKVVAATPVLPVTSQPAADTVASAATQTDATSAVPVFMAQSRPIVPNVAGPSHPSAALSPPPLRPATNVPPQLPVKRRRRVSGYMLAGTVLLVILLIVGGVVAFQHFPLMAALPASTDGHAFFVSSGLTNADSAQGIADQLQIDVPGVATPAVGKSYHAWLLGDIDPLRRDDLTGPLPVNPPILLTKSLPVQDGHIHYFFPGDAAHNNLLSATSRLLITEEDANSANTTPSNNRATWRYYAVLPQKPIAQDAAAFSALIHIRHLFYNEVDISVLGLPGGLDVWLSNNTEKLLEWSVSARDNWHGQQTNDAEIQLMKNQFISILDYLDGLKNVHVDMPANTPVRADQIASKVGLLTVDPANQGGEFNKTNPLGYIDHTQFHVAQIAKASDISATMRQRLAHIIESLQNVNAWLKVVHQDAAQLFNSTPDQLRSPESGHMLDDIVTLTTYAYIGKLDPVTNQVHPGITQAHYDIQQLATFTITKNLPAHL